MRFSILLRLALVVASGSLLAGFAAAADPTWPRAKPITWLVGYPPGGSVDVLTRQVARSLSEKLGTPVVVENRPGASGAIALQAAAKATPDGHTLITVPGPILTAQPLPELGKQFIAVSMLAQGPMVLVGPQANAVAGVRELIAEMGKNPKSWSYASSGNGTSQHLAGEMFNAMAGTAMTHIPYKGGGQAITDVVAGQVPLAILGVSPVLPHVKAGKLKAYAVTTRFRIDSLSNVPTMQEAGLKDYDASQWYAVGVPTGTPADRVADLNGWLNEIVASANLKETLAAGGAVAGKGSPRETQDFINADSAKWKELAQKLKLDLN